MSWTQHGGVLEPTLPAEQGNAAETCVLGPDENGVWRAYYSCGTNGAARIRLATSRDGITWDKHGVVISENYPANRVNVIRDGAMYYAVICDMSGPGYNGGNLLCCPSANGIDFYLPSTLILAVEPGKLWQNSRPLKIGSDWYLFAEAESDAHLCYTYLFKASSPLGPWVAQNNGERLLSLNPSGTDTGANETSSPPSCIVKGDRVYGFSWVNNFYATGSLGATEIYLQSAPISDLTQWSKPRRLLTQASQPLWAGRSTVQLADPCALEVDGKVYLYCSQVDSTGHARTLLNVFDGPVEALFDEDNSWQGNRVALKQPAVGQLMRFGAGREWEPIDAFDAILTAPPTGTTATVSGNGAPSPNGTFNWHTDYEQFTIPGQWSLIHISGAWELRDAANVARYRGPTAPATFPTGPLTALAGATGTANVVFNPATATKRALYGGNGSPMFTAPRGSLYVRKDGTGSALYVFETEWIAK